jgi:hypothetical protein
MDVDEFVADARERAERLYAAQEEAIDLEAEAEAAYKAMYPQSPEDITPRGSGSRRRAEHHHGSIVWDAVDWSM